MQDQSSSSPQGGLGQHRARHGASPLGFLLPFSVVALQLCTLSSPSSAADITWGILKMDQPDE